MKWASKIIFLLVTVSTYGKDVELPLCPTQIQYFPQQLPMHCRLPKDYHDKLATLPTVPSFDESYFATAAPGALHGAIMPGPPSMMAMPPVMPPPLMGPPNMPPPIMGPPNMPPPVPPVIAGSPNLPPPIMGPPPPLIPAPIPIGPPKLPVIVMPIYKQVRPKKDKDKKSKHKSDKPSGNNYSSAEGSHGFDHDVKRRPTIQDFYDRRDKSTDDSSDSDRKQHASGKYFASSKDADFERRNLRRSNKFLSDKLKPVLQYYTEDGYVIFEKELPEKDAEVWLKLRLHDDDDDDDYKDIDGASGIRTTTVKTNGRIFRIINQKKRIPKT